MKKTSIKDEDHEKVVQTAVDNALTYAEDRINHFKLFDDGEMTDVRRGLELSLNEVANVSWRAMFENTDGVRPETVAEALEIAEKDTCDYVHTFIEERLDSSVKDGDRDEVVQQAWDRLEEYALDRLEESGLIREGDRAELPRELHLGLSKEVDAAWDSMFNGTSGPEPGNIGEAVERIEQAVRPYVDGFLGEDSVALQVLNSSSKGSMGLGAEDEMKLMDENLDVETMALAAYFKKFGEHAAAPSAPEIVCEGGTDYVVLENIYGILAVYEIVDDETVVWSDHLPEGYSEDDDMRRAEG